jgi:glycerophosphoryl diester phosphodiesterase
MYRSRQVHHSALVAAFILTGGSLAMANVLSIAHRGDSINAPENTLAAVDSAASISDLIETDVRVSSDGELVLMHDGNVDRTTDGSGAVSSKTLADLKLLDAGFWFGAAFTGERVPTMAEMITNALPRATPLIERKAGTAQQYVDELQRLGVETDVVVQAFDWNFLGQVHALDPSIELAALGSGELTEAKLDSIIASGAGTVAWGGVSAAGVAMVHARGLKLFVWTVNSSGAIANYIEMGVDGIITDNPGLVNDLRPPPGALDWSALTTSDISTTSATASAGVDTNLTAAVLVWEETATAPSPSPGSTNDWAYRLDLGPVAAGPVSGQMPALAGDTGYTWRLFGVSATTNGWSSATAFATALTDAQAPEFVGTEGLSLSTIRLTWLDHAAQETSYMLRRSTNSSSGPYTYTDVGNTTTHLDSGLSPETTYYYALAATNSANGSATDFARAVTHATTLGIGSDGSTVIRFNGMTQNNNVAVPSDFGSNLSSDILGATVFNGGTPDIALSWTGGWELHGKAADYWDALDPDNATVSVAQMEDGTPSITFTVADGLALRLDSVDIGMASDKTATYNFTITIAEVGGGVVATYTPPAMDGDGSSGVRAQTVALNFTGDPSVDYILQFADSPDTNGGAIDNLNFSQVADSIPGDILLSSTRIASNAVPGSLVGNLSYNTNDQSNITYELMGSGPDNGRFQITAGTNLRTVATIDQSVFNISIAAQKDGAWLATNAFTITATPVASAYSAFIVAAEVKAGVATGGELVGVLEAEGADSSPFTFSLTGGRTDLFEVDGTGTDLVQVTGTDPGPVGTIHYVETEAANTATTNHLVVKVEVVRESPSGFLMIVR